MSNDLPERFLAHLKRTRLFTEPADVLVAVSGGPDSLALLDLMAGVAPALKLRLCVVHADHGIHEHSAAVAERVVALAQERYGIETVVGRLNLGAPASESAARVARYRFLRLTQAERGARWLLTAHHAGDQAETVMLRVLRGTAPSGLAAIPARGPRGLLRPLLPFSRGELAAHAAQRGLDAFTDPANTDPRHDRSWVRSEVLPVLSARLGEQAGRALRQVSAHARRELRAWDAALDVLPTLDLRREKGGFSVARSALRDYDKVLAGRVLRAAARRAGLRVGPRAAERVALFAADAGSGRRHDVGEGIIAEVAFDRLVMFRQSPTPDPRPLTPEVGVASFGGFQVSWRAEPAPEHLERESWTTWIAPAELSVRVPGPGDRLVPLRGTGHRAVARLLMEARIARGERASWPVLVQGGEPVWIPGVCRSDAALPAPGDTAVRVDVTAG